MLFKVFASTVYIFHVGFISTSKLYTLVFSIETVRTGFCIVYLCSVMCNISWHINFNAKELLLNVCAEFFIFLVLTSDLNNPASQTCVLISLPCFEVLIFNFKKWSFCIQKTQIGLYTKFQHVYSRDQKIWNAII